jgi:adenine-specific DNA methylase
METIRNIAEITLYIVMIGGVIAFALWEMVPCILMIYFECKEEKEDKREKDITVYVVEDTDDGIKTVIKKDVEDREELCLNFSKLDGHKEIKFGDVLNVTITCKEVLKYEKVDNIAVTEVRSGEIIKDNAYSYTVQMDNNEREVVEADSTFIVGDKVEVKECKLSIPDYDFESKLMRMKRI